MAQNSSSTLTRMWQTRPPRIPKDQGGKALFGGVCVGIGERYNMDPVVVRIIFVLFAFLFGGGIFAYLLCWFLMPRYGMTMTPARSIITPKNQLAPREAAERKAGWWLLIGLVVFVPSASTTVDARGLFASIAVFLLVWFIAYARHPEPPAGLIAQPRIDDLR